MELEKLQWQMNCCCDGSKIQDNHLKWRESSLDISSQCDVNSLFATIKGHMLISHPKRCKTDTCTFFNLLISIDSYFLSRYSCE